MKQRAPSVSRVGSRFAAHTSAAFGLMLVPCALHVACFVGVLPSALADEIMALSISGAAVGSAHLLRRLCEGG